MNETSGSPIRDARSLDGPFLTLDLEDVLGELDDESTTRDEPRTSMTVVHRPELRLVVSRLRDGATIGDERCDEDVFIVALDGRADLDVDGRAASLRRGTLASVASGHRWSLSGRDEAVAVLVFGAGATGRPSETDEGRQRMATRALAREPGVLESGGTAPGDGEGVLP